MALPLNSFHCWSRNVNEDVSRVCTLSALTELTDADDKILKDSRYNDKGVVTDTASDAELVLPIRKAFSTRFVRSEFFRVHGICGKVALIRKLNFHRFFFYNVCVANLRENIRITHLNAKLIFLIKKSSVL